MDESPKLVEALKSEVSAASSATQEGLPSQLGSVGGVVSSR
jgi:hypothetical protein